MNPEKSTQTTAEEPKAYQISEEIPIPEDEDLSNLNILQVLNYLVLPHKIEHFFIKRKHVFKIYGSDKTTQGKYVENNGMYITIKYIDGCQSWKTKWGLGARGFCAMWCSDQYPVSARWEPLKIGMQTSFEIPSGESSRSAFGESSDDFAVAAEDTQDGFSYTSNKFSQADICKIIDFNKGVDDVTYTFKVDGQYLVANVYSAEMSKIVFSVLHKLYSKKTFSIALAKYSMLRYGHVVILSTNNTWLTPEEMIPSIVTAMWSHFMPHKTYENLCADKRSFQKVFDEDLRNPFLSSLMNFCNTSDKTLTDTVYVSFEVCCKNNTPARKEKIHGLAVTSQESALFLLGYHDGKKFHPHSTQECQIRVVNSRFRDPCFWVMNSAVILNEFYKAIMYVIIGKLTEKNFFNMFPPHNKRSNPIDSYAFHPEGGVVYVDERYFKLKTPVYYWVHKPKEHYWNNIIALPDAASKYFPNILYIKAFVMNMDEFVTDLIENVFVFRNAILENDKIMEAFVQTASKNMLQSFESKKESDPETALKMVINSRHIKDMIINDYWNEFAAAKKFDSTLKPCNKIRSLLFSIMMNNSSDKITKDMKKQFIPFLRNCMCTDGFTNP